MIAADNAKIIQIFVRRGLIPDGGVAYLLPRLVGLHKAKELIFFGDDLSAVDAEKLGIVNKVVPAAELQATAKEWAERLASGPTKTIGWSKKMLHDASELSRRDHLEEEAMLVELNTMTAGLRRRHDRLPRTPPARLERLVNPSSWRRIARERLDASRRSEDHGVPDLINDKTAVVGIGQTAFGKGLPDTELSLACQAIALALDDAGIAPEEVDGLAQLHDGAEPRGRGRPRRSASATSPTSHRSASAAARAAA